MADSIQSTRDALKGFLVNAALLEEETPVFYFNTVHQFTMDQTARDLITWLHVAAAGKKLLVCHLLIY